MKRKLFYVFVILLTVCADSSFGNEDSSAEYGIEYQIYLRYAIVAIDEMSVLMYGPESLFAMDTEEKYNIDSPIFHSFEYKTRKGEKHNVVVVGLQEKLTPHSYAYVFMTVGNDKFLETIFSRGISGKLSAFEVKQYVDESLYWE